MIDIKETDREEHPRYRIDFWARPAPGYAWNSDIWLIEDAPNVATVMEWADRHAQGRRYQLLVSTRSDTEHSNYILLMGSNPNDPSALSGSPSTAKSLRTRLSRLVSGRRSFGWR